MGRHLKEGDVVFDIGANLGWYSIHAASVLGGTGRVVSFEANPKTFEYFEKNIIENSMERNIDAKFGALWDESCSEVLLVPEEMPFNPGSAFVKSEKSHASQQGEVIVSAMQLSTLDLPPANFIKIDVEGAEYRALAPYIDVLKETHPIIMSELYPRQLELVSGVSVDEYVQMFVDIGYQVEDLSGCVLTKSIIQNMAYDSPHTIVFKNSESDKAV
jgi:FkbM family methyltransferase